MPVYMIIEIAVTDPIEYAEYKRRVPATIARHGGRYIVRGGPVDSLGGDWNPERIVVLEFPTLEQMRAWSASPEYLEAAAFRDRGATTRAIAVEGFESTKS